MAGKKFRRVDKSGFLIEEKRVAILLAAIFFFQSIRNWASLF
jgi:hypothetical protein